MEATIIIEFSTFYLLFWWVMCILYKDNFLVNELENVGNWFKKDSILGNFFLDVSECQFCIENHIATIGAVFYSAYTLDYKYLFWGFLCASLSSILKK